MIFKNFKIKLARIPFEDDKKWPLSQSQSFLQNKFISNVLIYLLGRFYVTLIYSAIIFCTLSLEALPFISSPVRQQNVAPHVRVLLDTLELPIKIPVAVTTSGARMSIAAGTKKPVIIGNSMTVTVKRGALLLQGKKYPASVEISSDDNLSYAGKTYHGTLRLLVQGNSLMIINQVPLEQYICSVLKTESWPGWPLEVNKVFAVTSRTYVLYMVAEAQRVGRSYDVHNSKKHQTYSGVHDTKILQDAVEQTKGMILSYQGKPILAMFDSCCGGVIPARMHDVNFDDAPYLARTYACTHCKPCWIFNWKAALTTKELAEHLFKDERKKPKIRSLRITKKDPAGLIHEVEIHSGEKTLMTGKQLYASLKEVKSFVYTITKEKDKILFQGRGYGHHLGLCQWGAREAVRSGWNYKRILQFYYPGTQLVRF